MEENLGLLLERALEHYRNNLLDSSIREFKSIAAKFPDNAKIHLYLSYALEKKALENKESAFFILALNEAKAALKLDPAYKDIHSQIINLYHKTDQLDAAIAEYKEYLEREPENKLWQECLKQITVLSSFKAEATMSSREKTSNSAMGWILIFSLLALIILVAMLFAFRYLQMKTQS